MRTWKHVVAVTHKAANEEASTTDVYVALWLVLQGEPELRLRKRAARKKRNRP